ncbi:nicotinamide mononucleotide transporter family protein [Ureaplasma ceti]|uniref:Uncharacterized protein n=1 Tax=Ureaplasma ceti TaxID=3119530 RepID=A0ABP9U8P8_9BACT
MRLHSENKLTQSFQKEWKENKFDWIVIWLLTLTTTILSLFSINQGRFIWEENVNTVQKVLGIAVAVSAITGFLGTYLFFRRNQWAFLFAIFNAVLYGAYCYSLNLFAEFLIYVIIYTPTYIVSWWKLKVGKKIKTYRLNWKISLIFLTLFIVLTIVFYFSFPLMTYRWNLAVHNPHPQFDYFFKDKLAGTILAMIIDATLIVAFLMMILGFKETWIVWQVKNVLSIILFAGVGMLNYSVIGINICYLVIATYICIKEYKMKGIRIGFTGVGSSGKSYMINDLRSWFEEQDFLIKDEREYGLDQDSQSQTNDNKYMNYLKGDATAFESQEQFFIGQMAVAEAAEQHLGNVLFNRTLHDSFLYSEVHVRNGNFSPAEILKWQKLKQQAKRFLATKTKLDILFVFLPKSWDVVQQFREEGLKNTSVVDHERRKLEFKKLSEYQEFFKAYFDDSYNEWLEIARSSCKEIIFIDSSKENYTMNKKIIQEKIQALKNKKVLKNN